MLFVYRLKVAGTIGNLDPRISSAVEFSNGIPSAVGFPGSILSIDSMHGSLLVHFVDWPHAWWPLGHFIDWPHLWQLLSWFGSLTGPGEGVNV